MEEDSYLSDCSALSHRTVQQTKSLIQERNNYPSKMAGELEEWVSSMAARKINTAILLALRTMMVLSGCVPAMSYATVDHDLLSNLRRAVWWSSDFVRPARGQSSFPRLSRERPSFSTTKNTPATNMITQSFLLSRPQVAKSLSFL